ncbi:sugar kinase [Leptotrichia sp. OH3620_COT-345]|uniref:sugar kinase n=1 Tax=Leptotrichia sp. OH3620_COT-345 TaxID=2491048 RepID=UPI000F64E998|nr:sugar kinase [Leptotrichia sp. OH3620_COT-345]RRD40169.1 sugar kinase [Leptotrichia sp. OH3620_COT-345]
MKKVLSFGEILLRLSPQEHKMIIQSNTDVFEIFYGGAELNISIALSNFGIKSGYITKVPDNALGHKGIKYLKQYGVDTDDIEIGGERIGIYFLENGYSLRPSVVTYDRRYSAFSEMEMTDEKMEKILSKYDVLFLSGITLSVSEKSFELSKRMIKIAKKLKKEVVFDCNYRSKLISLEEASRRYKEIINNVDVLFASYLDFVKIFGIEHNLYNDTETYKEYYQKLYKKVYKIYNFKYIISSIRKPLSSNRNIYSGIITNGENIVKGKEYIVEIKDRVGTGDAFTSGVIYSYLSGNQMEEMINFGIGSGVLKHTIYGDVSEFKKEDILKIINTDSYDVIR